MKFARSILVSSLGALAALAGPSAFADSSPPDEAADLATAEGELAQKAAPANAIDLVALTNDLLGKDHPLRANQVQAVRSLEGSLQKVAAPIQDAEHALVIALADGLAKGSISRDAVAPQVRAFVDASAKAGPEMRRVLERLHGILDPSQRAAFADAILGRMQQLSGGQEGAAAATRMPNVDRLARDLKLTEKQRGDVKALFDSLGARIRAGTGQAKAFRDMIGSFKGNQFSASQAGSPSPEVNAADAASRLVTFFDGLAKTLTSDQRTMLANRLRGSAAQQGAKLEESQGALEGAEAEDLAETGSELVFGYPGTYYSLGWPSTYLYNAYSPFAAPYGGLYGARRYAYNSLYNPVYGWSGWPGVYGSSAYYSTSIPYLSGWGYLW